MHLELNLGPTVHFRAETLWRTQWKACQWLPGQWVGHRRQGGYFGALFFLGFHNSWNLII